MRIGIDKLIVKALTALEEVGFQAQLGPIAPSWSLRFILAYLYAHGDGRRDSFDRFWRAVTDTGEFVSDNPAMANIARSNGASVELYGIYRAVGVYRSTDMIFSWLPDRHKGKTHTPDGQEIAK